MKSCYRTLQGENDSTYTMFWRKLWSLRLPGKILNFLWRTCKRVLPIAATLITKRVNISMMCPWCQVHMEDAIHMLFKCEFAKDVWRTACFLEMVPTEGASTVFDVCK